MNQPPTGTVTFVFTDIEGSTRLAQLYPNKWESLRARHHAILKSAIESQNGYIFQIIGDAFCAAFHTARDALQAAIKSQVNLQAENWDDTPVKVRMGVHTGSAEIQEDGNYTGYLTLCRVQRLMSAGHGGQTLISQSTQYLVCEELPQGITLRDLGECRLKDLARPERIFQPLSPDLPADFPPLRTLDAFSNNLPVQLTSFIGREKEIGEVKRLLQEKRLVTLTGPGGTGKTRLALQTAADLLEAFPNGAWLVELAPIADPALVPQTVATALGVREQQGRPLLDTLTDYLREKNLLLILDNCEHLVEACATLADALLHTCPGLKILASSREALGMTGEVPFRVPSLSTPDTRHLPPTPTLLQYEAVHLFIERATTALPDFTVTDDNAPVLARICQRLDGIPLAIELAAARMRMLSIQQIASRLDDCFRLLTGGSRTALPRLQTLRALIDWSYNLLSGPERTLLQRLSVFAAGWTLEAAEAVCMDECAGMEVLDLLTQLANKSLVIVDCEQGQEARYHLLETVRQYAGEKLAETGEGARVRARHLAYFLEFAEEAEPCLLRAEQLDWLASLDREHDNLRAALEWALSSVGTDPALPPEAGLRLANAQWRFLYTRGHWQEGREALGRALASPGQPRTVAYAQALCRASPFENHPQQQFRLLDESITLCRELGDKPALAHALLTKGITANIKMDDQSLAKLLLKESLTLYRELGDKWGTAISFYHLGQISCLHEHDIPAARRFSEESLRLSQEIGDRRGANLALNLLGVISTNQGDLSGAQSFFEKSLSFARELDDKYGTAVGLSDLGMLARGQGDYPRAVELLEEGLAITREIGDKYTIAGFLFDLGRVARFQGDYKKAADLYTESLSIAQQLGIKFETADALTGLGELARLQGDYESARGYITEAIAFVRDLNDHGAMVYLIEESAALRAAQGEAKQAAKLFGAAGALRTDFHIVPLPVERLEIDRKIALVRTQLDEAMFNAAWAEGSKMTYEQAVAYLLE